MLIVVKIGGDILADGIPGGLVDELASLGREHRLILVHGGGDVVTKISTELGHPPRFVLSPKGFRSRYTDREESRIFTMVMAGKINKELVSELQARGVQAVGLSGLDGALVRATRKRQIVAVDERGRRMLMEGGYTGEIKEVKDGLLRLLLDNGYAPVISPIAMGEEAEPLNVDGDRMASRVASTLGADALILLTDVGGLRLNDRVVERLSLHEARDVLKDIGPGMITKIYASTEALEGGVGEVIIASGFAEEAISSALGHKNCTVITR